jgi:hypothetical protein
LLLPPGEFTNPAILKACELNHPKRIGNLSCNLTLRQSSLFQTERYVGGNAHMWPKGIALKHHRGFPAMGWNVVDALRAKANGPALRL